MTTDIKDSQNTTHPSQAKTYKQITIKIRKDSTLHEAVDLCQRLTGFPVSTYAKIALAEKLKNDGYLNELEEKSTLAEQHKQQNKQPLQKTGQQNKKPATKTKQKNKRTSRKKTKRSHSTKDSNHENGFPIMISQRTLYSKYSSKSTPSDNEQK